MPSTAARSISLTTAILRNVGTVVNKDSISERIQANDLAICPPNSKHSMPFSVKMGCKQARSTCATSR